jgi:fucose 4-O-acetylase-like acetyltransferase
MTGPEKTRLTELDMAKGLAIFLVVLGHLSPGNDPAGNEWYLVLRVMIYKFHMPVFMFISGAIFYHTYRPFTTVSGYAGFVGRRASRLVPGFLIFSLLIWSSKVLAARSLNPEVFDTRKLGAGGVAPLLEIVTHPGASVARSLWFIYVLFQFYVFFPLLLRVVRGNLVAVIIISAGLHALTHLISVPSAAALNQFCEYTLYFSLGMAFIMYQDRVGRFLRQNVLVALTVFAVSFLSVLLQPGHISKTIVGLCSLPAIYAFTTCLRSTSDQRILLVLGHPQILAVTSAHARTRDEIERAVRTLSFDALGPAAGPDVKRGPS